MGILSMKKSVSVTFRTQTLLSQGKVSWVPLGQVGSDCMQGKGLGNKEKRKSGQWKQREGDSDGLRKKCVVWPFESGSPS